MKFEDKLSGMMILMLMTKPDAGSISPRVGNSIGTSDVARLAAHTTFTMTLLD